MKERFISLIKKTMSLKFLIFIITTVLRCCSVVGNTEWLTVALCVICGREGQKIAERIIQKNS